MCFDNDDEDDNVCISDYALLYVFCCRFHLACIGLDQEPSLLEQQQSFWCLDCCSTRKKVYVGHSPREKLYCICREPVDNVPMICCDFCDEWFHAKCVGMSPVTMSSLEAYRCQACAIRDRMGHLQSKRRPRPALKQVVGLIARGESIAIEIPALRELRALVARGNEIHQSVIDFEAHFFSTFSMASILKRINDVQSRLDQHLNDVRQFEVLIQLEPVHKKLRAINWVLRASRLILANKSAPRYVMSSHFGKRHDVHNYDSNDYY
jgi:histone demethylase JARID1